MKETLKDWLPILEIDAPFILSKAGDYTIGFEVTKPEIYTLKPSEYDTLNQAWVKVMRLLPYQSIIYMQDWYTTATYQADFDRNGNSMLSRASERFFHERPHLDHRCYLFFTKMPADRMSTGNAFSPLIHSSLIPQDILKPDVIQHFMEQVLQCISVLATTKLLSFRFLSSEDMSGDDTNAGIIEQYCQLTEQGYADRRQVDSPVKWRREGRDIGFANGIRIGDFYCPLYTIADLTDLPAQCSTQTGYPPYATERTPFNIGFVTPLGPLLDCNHLYSQYIILQDPQITIKAMELKKRKLQSLSAHSRENNLTRQAMDDFLNATISGQNLLVKAHFNIMSWTDDPREVQTLKTKVSSAITQIGATPHLETHAASPIWFAGIPGNAGALPLFETFDTHAEQAACFMVSETNYRSSISPFGIRLGDRITGMPIHVDISDEPLRLGQIYNRNKFLFSSSGAGKSFFANHLVRSYFEQGAHILIVDIGNSYQGLCQLTAGHYFTYSERTPIQFNPFWLQEGESAGTEKKESIKTLLLTLWKKDDERFLRSEYVALSNALQSYYDHLALHPDLFPCFDTFYEFLENEFITRLEQEHIKEKDFDIHNFLYVLKPYHSGGEFDYLLNARQNMDLLNQRFIVFELDLIKDHPILFPVVTIIIMEVFLNKMRNLPGTRKVIIIEEAWKAIAKQGMSEYIKYLFKTVRKFFGEAIVVTQEIDDIISSPVVKQTIINNADCKILLDQSKFLNRFDQIQDLLGLTDHDKALVLSLNKANEPGKKYKEVFISLANGPSKVYRTEVSLEEYYTYTTEESEKVKVREYAKKFGSFQKGISALAAEMREEAQTPITPKDDAGKNSQLIK